MKYILFLFILTIIGCGVESKPTDVDIVTSGGVIIERELSSDTQNISIIYCKRLNNWINTHKNVNIISMTSLDYDTYGKTNGFIIIWKPTNYEEIIKYNNIILNGKQISIDNETMQKISKLIEK